MQRHVISARQHVDQLQVEVCVLWQLIEQQVLRQQQTNQSKNSVGSGPSNVSMQSQGVMGITVQKLLIHYQSMLLVCGTKCIPILSDRLSVHAHCYRE